MHHKIFYLEPGIQYNPGGLDDGYTKLEIRRYVSDKDVIDVMRRLKTNVSVSSLCVVEMCHPISREVYEMLHINRSIHDLDITFEFDDDEEENVSLFQGLVNVLSSNTTIRNLELWITCDALTRNVIDMLLERVITNPILRVLALDCRIPDPLYTIKRILCESSIHMFYFEVGEMLSVGEIGGIMDALKHNQYITYLCIIMHSLEDKSSLLDYISEVLDTNEVMTSLGLRYRQCDIAIRPDVSFKLERNRRNSIMKRVTLFEQMMGVCGEWMGSPSHALLTE